MALTRNNGEGAKKSKGAHLSLLRQRKKKKGKKGKERKERKERKGKERKLTMLTAGLFAPLSSSIDSLAKEVSPVESLFGFCKPVG